MGKLHDSPQAEKYTFYILKINFLIMKNTYYYFRTLKSLIN